MLMKLDGESVEYEEIDLELWRDTADALFKDVYEINDKNIKSLMQTSKMNGSWDSVVVQGYVRNFYHEGIKDLMDFFKGIGANTEINNKGS